MFLARARFRLVWGTVRITVVIGPAVKSGIIRAKIDTSVQAKILKVSTKFYLIRSLDKFGRSLFHRIFHGDAALRDFRRSWISVLEAKKLFVN